LKPELGADRIGFALHRSDEMPSDPAAEAALPRAPLEEMRRRPSAINRMAPQTTA